MIEKINKLSLPATILITGVILGGFYYASEANKQKSIERQKEMEIEEQYRVEANIAREKANETLKKSACVDIAEQTAIELYKDYCTKSSYCAYKEGTYLVPQYDNAYSKCLQERGLK
ncbi:MAG: hypothetical protein Q7R94_01445 [bacterium]|nr:hypothetical protein [bacterium]